MRFARDYSLSLVLAGLFIVSWLLQTWTGWIEFAAEQQSHGEAAELFGDSGYFWTWGQATFENWQSEFLQLFTMVVLVTFLIHKGSHESKDSEEETRALLQDIEERVYRMETGQTETAAEASAGSSGQKSGKKK